MTKHASITVYVAALTAAITIRAMAVDSDSAVAVAVEEGVPGGAIVAAQQTTATVEAIAPDTRVVTLVTADGKKSDYTAGPEVANFDQLKVGDQLKVTAIQAIAIALRKGDTPTEDSATAGVALAPLGDKPGMLIGGVVEVHATVKALDVVARTATLEMPDGTAKTVEVRKDVDMAKAAVGDKVAIKLVEALAITVEAP